MIDEDTFFKIHTQNQSSSFELLKPLHTHTHTQTHTYIHVFKNVRQ